MAHVGNRLAQLAAESRRNAQAMGGADPLHVPNVEAARAAAAALARVPAGHDGRSLVAVARPPTALSLVPTVRAPPPGFDVETWLEDNYLSAFRGALKQSTQLVRLPLQNGAPVAGALA